MKKSDNMPPTHQEIGEYLESKKLIRAHERLEDFADRIFDARNEAEHEHQILTVAASIVEASMARKGLALVTHKRTPNPDTTRTHAWLLEVFTADVASFTIPSTVEIGIAATLEELTPTDNERAHPLLQHREEGAQYLYVWTRGDHQGACFRSTKYSVLPGERTIVAAQPTLKGLRDTVVRCLGVHGARTSFLPPETPEEIAQYHRQEATLAAQLAVLSETPLKAPFVPLVKYATVPNE